MHPVLPGRCCPGPGPAARAVDRAVHAARLGHRLHPPRRPHRTHRLARPGAALPRARRGPVRKDTAGGHQDQVRCSVHLSPSLSLPLQPSHSLSLFLAPAHAQYAKRPQEDTKIRYGALSTSLGLSPSLSNLLSYFLFLSLLPIPSSTILK
jgi:hypothetical protein